MGALTSRQNAGVEEVDVVSNHAYKYPPRSGNYFGSHFIMGGERFDTPQPEAYLFGENADLNFLGSKPTPFPYPPPQANEPTKTLKSLVNIRKESLRFVRSQEVVHKPDHKDADIIKSSRFNIEFTFDADAKCAITIYFFCAEDFGPNGVNYTSREPTLTSETFHYKRGANQQFCQPGYVFDPSQYNEDELAYSIDKEVIPVVIHCLVEEGSDEPRQSHTTIAIIEKHSDGTYVLKALKQKLFVDGLCYLLQEIYGIENKNNDNNKGSGDDDMEDNGSECVICMCDVRDTLILPCRHLCLCNSCADSLRYQANNCPICRAPFRALLQVRALQRCPNMLPVVNQPTDGSCENIPAGYEAVSLLEALNGPCIIRPVQPPTICDPETPDTDGATQAAEILNRSNLERSNNGRQGSPRETENKSNRLNNSAQPTPEFRMSVLLSREDQNHKESTSTQSPLLSQSNTRMGNKVYSKSRDSVKLINEKNKEDQDTDSEAEKLSPLLDAATMTSAEILPLHIEGIVEPIDDTDTDLEDIEITKSPAEVNKHLPMGRSSRPILTDGDTVALAAGEDSDYFTPEDPQTTILSPVYSDKSLGTEIHPSCTPAPAPPSLETTPQRWNSSLKQRDLTSLPGTPQSSNSHTSNRSSGDSYSSSSSTRHLLALAPSSVISIATVAGSGDISMI